MYVSCTMRRAVIVCAVRVRSDDSSLFFSAVDTTFSRTRQVQRMKRLDTRTPMIGKILANFKGQYPLFLDDMIVFFFFWRDATLKDSAPGTVLLLQERMDAN